MRVALFVTCLVNVMRPSIASAAMALIRQTGITPFCPARQTCCGQVAYNSGYFPQAALAVEQCADLFENYDYVVFPSASCCSFFRVHWTELFDAENKKIATFSEKCLELSEFLEKMSYSPQPQDNFRATYHDCCAGLRELNIKNTPRRLLKECGGEIIEMPECEECCGFGGTFSIKFGNVSAAIADRKCDNIIATADTAILGDLGCLLHLQGRLFRRGDSVRIYHWAEILANQMPLL